MDKGVEYILEVAKCRGLKKAADNLFITSSALSKFVLAREAELGVQLFHRVGKEFIPTQAGEQYLLRCREIARIEGQLQDEMASFASLSHGTLRIGIQVSFIEVMFRSILPELQRQLPNLSVIFVEDRIGSLLQRLKLRQVDLMIAVTDLKEEGLCSEKIRDFEYVIAASDRAGLSEKAVSREGFAYPWLDVGMLQGLPMVGLSGGSMYRNRTDKLFERYGLTPEYMYQVMSTKSGLTCVAGTNAAMLTIDGMVKNNSLSEEIRIFSFGEKPVRIPLTLQYQEGTILQTEIQTLLEICRREIL